MVTTGPAPAEQVEAARPTDGPPVADHTDRSEGRVVRRAPVDREARSDAGPVVERRATRRTWIDHRPGYRVWVGGPVPPGAAAWTLGSLVIVRRRSAGSQRLMAHEEQHVRQWAERGVVGFLAWYLRGYLPWRLRGYPHGAAYRRIPAEIEAEWRSRRRLGIGTTDRPEPAAGAPSQDPSHLPGPPA